jgi:hypothetical protein
MQLLISKHDVVGDLEERLRQAGAASADLMSEIVDGACRRFPLMGATDKTIRIGRLMESGAWTDAALALIDLELPQWQVRRLAYDEGEWHCALSRQRELPEWLDQSIEAHHADLPLAILSAFVEARRASASAGRTSVPTVARDPNALYEPVLSDNFG